MATATDTEPRVTTDRSRRGPARWVALAFAVLVPAVVSGLLVFHPPGLGEALLGFGGQYYWMHIVLLLGFPATGVVLVVLLRGLRTPESWLARVAAFVYACAYGGYDALAGITIAAYTMEAEGASGPDQVESILAMRDPLSATGIIGQLAETGRLAWVVATVLTAVALVRASSGAASGAARAVRVLVVLPLLASGYLLFEHDHVPPLGWSAFAALALAALLIELVPRRFERSGRAGTARG